MRHLARDPAIARQYLECFALRKSTTEHIKNILEDALTIGTCHKHRTIKENFNRPYTDMFMRCLALEVNP
jgi:hypothetical protein